MLFWNGLTEIGSILIKVQYYRNGRGDPLIDCSHVYDLAARVLVELIRGARYAGPYGIVSHSKGQALMRIGLGGLESADERWFRQLGAQLEELQAKDSPLSLSDHVVRLVYEQLLGEPIPTALPLSRQAIVGPLARALRDRGHALLRE